MLSFVKLGHSTIACKHCKTPSVVENEVLENAREYRCPACGLRMTDYELASVKLSYFLLLATMYRERFGSVKQYEMLDCDIRINPEYKPDGVISAEDGS